MGKNANKEISRREFLGKQLLTPLGLMSMLFDRKIEKEVFDVDKLFQKDKKVFQQLAG